MFNPLITKPKTTIGFNPLILNISESKKRYLYAYGNQLVPFEDFIGGDIVFESNRIRFPNDNILSVARTQFVVNILGFSKVTIAWLGVLTSGSSVFFTLYGAGGAITAADVERTSSFGSLTGPILVRDSINLLAPSILGNADYPNFRVGAIRNGLNTYNAALYVYEIYLE